ncbi:MAG: enoyl-CoA hydratase/isomerase family protein [Saprospiraceae bacterium]|nr:enoyl-CoA hydratase/isomerase family protein [Saprospiraceae bacterium]
MDSIIVKKEKSVAYLTLNRPQVFNSMHTAMRKELILALDDCQTDPSVRAVCITGEGRAFCAGQDLTEAGDPDKPIPFKEVLNDEYNPIILKIRALEKPVVAAVNGVAAGAGANIALVCDIVVAIESASFVQAFSKIGLVPDCSGTWILPRLVGFGRASALMFLGEKLIAKDAEAMGMIYKCIPDASFKNEVTNLCESLAQMPTKGFALTKKALNASFFDGLAAQLAVEAECQSLAGQTEDYTEGVKAFIEKRRPIFKGQ